MFDNINKVVPKAFNTLDRAVGAETDEDLKLYNSLEPRHFGEIVKRYGEDNTLKYIQEMEKRRLKRGING